ncbi:MAG: ISAs1 family transposase [Pirellulales bacterium]
MEEWMKSAFEESADGASRLIAIDGKTCRRSHDSANGLGALHMVSAGASEDGIALGQVATEETSNEITAIPHLLSQLALEDPIVTIDAMGSQKEIARAIVDQGGDFVVTVQDNQPTLRQGRPSIRALRAPLGTAMGESDSAKRSGFIGASKQCIASGTSTSARTTVTRGNGT